MWWQQRWQWQQLILHRYNTVNYTFDFSGRKIIVNVVVIATESVDLVLLQKFSLSASCNNNENIQDEHTNTHGLSSLSFHCVSASQSSLLLLSSYSSMAVLADRSGYLFVRLIVWMDLVRWMAWMFSWNGLHLLLLISFLAL